MKFGGRFSRAAVVGGLVLALASIPVTPAGAVTMTGTYIGTGAPVRVNTGLATLKALTIVELSPHGQGAVAYTTDAIQATGQGTFLNGNKKDTGVIFDVANFVVTNPDFIQPGVTYGWEAEGD